MKMKFTIVLICFFFFLNAVCGNIRQKRSGKEENVSFAVDSSTPSHSSSTHPTHQKHHQHGKHEHETEEHKINKFISENDGANMHRTDIDNLIFSTFPIEQKQYIYNFEGIFHPQRIKQLIYIAENGGSIQSNDALQFKEFQIIKEMPRIFDLIERKEEKLNGAEIREIFLNAEKNLLTKLQHFDEHPDSELTNVIELEKISDEFVLKCKQFMREFHAEGNEGSFLDIFTFWKEKKYSNLGKIFKIADIHRENVDKLIDQTIWNEHLKNKKSNESPIKNVIIEGAGPIGLFAAFEFFLAGMNVRLVNNRVEYIRRQMVFLDRKWMSQLRFLLGTKFDTLFNKEKIPFNEETKLGRIDYGDVGQLNMRVIEKIMLQRLMELQKFNKNHMGDLVLIYGFEFEKIVEPEKEGEEKFRGKIVEKRGNNDGGENEKNVKEFPVDLLICAGGANDQIRNKYLGQPIEETDSRSYGVVVLVKGKQGQLIFDDQSVFFKLENMKNMKQIAQIIDEENFNQFIEQNKIYVSEEFANKYKHLSEMIKNIDTLLVRLFENWPTIHIATINTPEMIRTFFDALPINVNDMNKYKQIRDEMERKWAAVIFKISHWYVHHEKQKERIGKIKLKMTGQKKAYDEEDVLYFDPNPTNKSTFSVTIRSVPNAVVKKEKHGKSMIIAAVGDANTSPHFMTASGLSIGRIAVEKALEISVKKEMKANKNGKKYNWDEIFMEMKNLLSSLKNQMVKKVLEQTDMELANTSTFDKAYAEFLVRPYRLRLPENKAKMAGSG